MPISGVKAANPKSNPGPLKSQTAFLDLRRPANCRSSGNDRSAAWRIAPARSDVNSVLNYGRNDEVAACIFEHLPLALKVVLGVVFDKRDAFGIIVVASLLAIGAVGLYIDN